MKIERKMAWMLLSLTMVLSSCSPENREVVEADICIYGGTSAGVIAAYSADKLGKSVVLIEPGNRLGGLSTGGLGQTDIGNKYAVTGIARDFYRRLGKEYGKLEQWQFEPKTALKVYDDYLEDTEVRIIKMHRLNRVFKKNKVINAICLEKSDSPDAEKLFVRASQFIDCSYEGDLMARSGVSYTVGRESNKEYNETYNGVQLLDQHQFPDGIDPYIIEGDSASGLVWGVGKQTLKSRGSGDRAVQAYNFRICLTDSVENRIPVSRPDDYDSTKYELFARLVSKLGTSSIRSHFNWGTMPKRKTDINNHGGFSTDMIGMNWNYPEASYATRAKIIEEHKAYTIGLLYFMGNDPRLPESMRKEMKQWGYPKDEYLEYGHFTPQLYVREARRMIGAYVMTEANCVGKETVDDGIGMAAYTMDSHNCQRLIVNGMVKNEGDVQVGGFPPYPISYRSIIPKRSECSNLLVPVDLSATHIAYGSIRMEPVFMVLAQSAAMAASLAIDAAVPIQDIDISKLQEQLKSDPLLDGTKPEIFIDNSDQGMVEYSDNIHIEASKWEDKANKLDFLLAPEAKGERKVKFKIRVPEDGAYKVYYYCPGIYKLVDEVIGKLPISVLSADNINSTSINYDQNFTSWAYCGTFKFSHDKEAFLEANASGLKGAFAADAILVIPEK